MATRSAIEWTESTWNPVTGCTKISPGCRHCYAERMSRRLQAMGQPNYRGAFEVALHEQALSLPLKWRRPHTVFVNSMSDLFHKQVPDEFVQQVFAVMAQADWHRFQVLTKRAVRLARVASELPWPAHIWAGVSVESPAYLSRIDYLRETDAAVKFVSFEPLLEPLPALDLSGIDWVIVGGESGPGCRPMSLDWVRAIRDQCQAAGVPFFLKQLGGFPDKRGGDKAVLDGRVYHEMPDV